jgi:hypothetical protein
MESHVSPSQAVLAIMVTPAGRGLAIVTAKARAKVPPAPGIPGRLKAQAEPGEVPAQLQPEELCAALKVVFGGMVSWRAVAAES